MAKGKKQKKLRYKATITLLILLLTVTGCATELQETEDNEVMYLNLTWHQHQPLYYEDNGVITRPWVRVHATKDYYDMAAMLENYPEIKVTINLTPVLLRQLDALQKGTKDIYWVLAEKPADELTENEKQFILERFFDANWNTVIKVHPRYGELLAKRGDGSPESVERALGTFTVEDYRDLQVWFNLAWFDPGFLEAEPLSSLVEKGRSFTEADKLPLFDKVLEVLGSIVPEHRKLQDAGQIEVITTPYAHPILPLIYNSDLAEKGDPTSDMPSRFSYPNDAISQLQISADRYRADFGREPSGLWPGEGSVGQDIVRIVGKAGFKWMASGEQVLAKSIGLPGFTRNSNEVVVQADDLYRPYIVSDVKSGTEIYTVFRDLRISDLVGFEYSGMDAERAARDFIDRIEAIRLKLKEEGAEGPHLVSVILDGENAWENYPNDGKAFLNALYQQLSESETIKTTTVSEYIAQYPEQRRIDELWWGCWFTPDYATWIGESEENQGWEYLLKTREMLAKYDIAKKKTASPEALAEALDAMYLAEGSDWFWWYGSDQESGVDEYFDEAYRALLKKVYTSLGEEVPAFISVPIIPEKPAVPEKSPEAVFTPALDGLIGDVEWENSGYFTKKGGSMARAEDILQKVSYGWDTGSLYFGITSRSAWTSVPNDSELYLYLSLPGQESSISLSIGGEPLGFGAGYAVKISQSEVSMKAELLIPGLYDTWQIGGTIATIGISDRAVEFALPFSQLPTVQVGDQLHFRAVITSGGVDVSRIPEVGPGRAVMPDLQAAEPILSIQDQLGDDNGPGCYSYPTDAVFLPGSYDITSFEMGENEDFVIFKIGVNSPIANPWGSGIDLSVQTFDLYIDTDPGSGTGRNELLEGRNASLEAGNGWEFALWVEGWNQKLIKGYDDGNLSEVSGTPVKVLVDGEKGTVTLLLRKDAVDLDTPAAQWGIAAAVLSQDGFPSAGVRRVRDVAKTASQWKFGGAAGPTVTRIIDIALPEGSALSQAQALSEGVVPLIPVQ